MTPTPPFIPTKLIQTYRAAAEQVNLPVERLWLHVFQVFIHRITLEKRVTVAVQGQNVAAWENLLVEIDPKLRFSELIQKPLQTAPVSETALAAFQSGDNPMPPLPEKRTPPLWLALGLSARWIFNPETYPPEERAALPLAFIHLAENLAHDFNQPCSQVSLLSPAEWTEMENWNQTTAEFPSHASVHGLIAAQAQAAPERIAAVYQDEQLSYGALEARAGQIAQALLAAGVRAGQVVGLYLERNLDLLAAQLGILKTGAAYAALDLQYPREMLARLFENFDLPFILTETSLAELLPTRPGRLLLLDECLAAPAPAPQAYPEIDSEAPAFIIFTSGSTGVPKGVVHTHRNLLARFQAASGVAPLNSTEVVSQTSPLSSIDAIDEIYAPFLRGARVVMIPHTVVTDPRKLVALLENEGVTRMILVPSLLRIILTADDQLARRLTRLKTWLIGGEALTPTLVNLFYENLPTANLINFYGLTEGDATSYPTRPDETAPPVGRPIENARVYLLDANLQPVPPGLPGEICLASAGLFKEYWQRPDLNAEKWLDNPFNQEPHSPFARLFRTGDLGRWRPDGQLQYLGRRDRMVKIRSFRVELGEVEAALTAQAAVRECAVRVWQAATDLESLAAQPRIVAYVVLKANFPANELQLREGLKERLPDYALPKEIILLAALPSLPNGKVDYRALPEPGASAIETASDFSEPADDFELYLVKLWEWLLKRHPISTRANFFDLGGDSLLVILMITELEKELKQTLSLALLFHAPTIVELAAALREKGWRPAWSALVPIRPHGSRPPLFCVHADGGAFFYNRFTSHIAPEQPIYGIQARGLDGVEEPFTRVEDMAAHYLSEIRSVQPEGPYLISGFSMGGVVIYEMGRQLQASGAACLLIFLDAPSPTYPEMLEAKNMSKVKRLMKLTMRERLERFSHRLGQRFRWLKDEASSRLVLSLGQPLNPSLRIHRVRELNQKIAENYQPQPYADEVVILYASEQPAGTKPDPSLGWSRHVHGPITSRKVEGNHESIFKEPAVRELAQKLQAEIDAWLARQSGSQPELQTRT